MVFQVDGRWWIQIALLIPLCYCLATEKRGRHFITMLDILLELKSIGLHPLASLVARARYNAFFGTDRNMSVLQNESKSWTGTNV